MSVFYKSSRAISFISKNAAPEKCCTVCGRMLAKNRFHFHPDTYDRLQSNCMDCTKMYSYYGAQINWPHGYIIRGTESLWSKRFLTGPSMVMPNPIKITYTVLQGRKPTVLFFKEGSEPTTNVKQGYLGTLAMKNTDPIRYEFWAAEGKVKDRLHVINTDSFRSAIIESIRIIRKLHATDQPG